MNVTNYLKMSILTLVRDAMFYGYHMSQSRIGNNSVKNNAIDFCDIFFPEMDYDVVIRSYYNFINNFKSNKF